MLLTRISLIAGKLLIFHERRVLSLVLGLSGMIKGYKKARIAYTHTPTNYKSTLVCRYLPLLVYEFTIELWYIFCIL